MANQQGAIPAPLSWAEQWQISSWQFHVYRTLARPQRMFADDEYEGYRNDWAQRMLPLPKIVHRRYEKVQPMQWSIPSRIMGLPSLDAAPSPFDETWYDDARRTAGDVQRWFAEIPNVTFVKTLGFGGHGVTVKFKHQVQGQSPIDFVVKTSHISTENEAIRLEAEQLKKVNRAAHCIQEIPKARLGLLPQQPYLFDIPPDDDSSDDGQSSGDDSIDNEPANYRDNRTRRQKIAADPAAMAQKSQRHRNRIRRASLLNLDRDNEIRRRHRVIREREREARRARREGRPVRPRPGIPQPDNYHPDIWNEGRRDMLLLEFGENGDLETLLYRLTENQLNVPNRVLWSFWFCMVRSCVAMQYPPRKFHPKRKEADPQPVAGHPAVDNVRVGKRVGNDLFEDIPPARRRWRAKRYVHFDIDPANILITGIDVNARDNEHKLVPRLKLADFSFAREVKPGKRNVYYKNMREDGKWSYYPPEQFGVDWDYIQTQVGGIIDRNGPEISEEPIAGNYGSAMNVWGIAVVLWQLMTQMCAPMPPQPQVKTGHHAYLPENYCPRILDVVDYDYIDIDLRRTVARCMAHNPRDRPELTQLLSQARAGINKNFEGETDQFIRDWIQAVIYDA
ncbi:kinase-like domain-containing protein [Nemania abortiva]|nr:kinase-like domain-containing protein [Nemania abortiva]